MCERICVCEAYVAVAVAKRCEVPAAAAAEVKVPFFLSFSCSVVLCFHCRRSTEFSLSSILLLPHCRHSLLSVCVFVSGPFFLCQIVRSPYSLGPLNGDVAAVCQTERMKPRECVLHGGLHACERT